MNRGEAWRRGDQAGCDRKNRPSLRTPFNAKVTTVCQNQGDRAMGLCLGPELASRRCKAKRYGTFRFVPEARQGRVMVRPTEVRNRS